jgi:hypothetical protein
MHAEHQRTKCDKFRYAVLRTWAFETCFTVLPMTLMVLIIAGMYSFNELAKVETQTLVYQHSFSPLLHAMREYMDVKTQPLTHIKEVIEGGGWADPGDDEALLRYVVPKMLAGSEHDSGYSLSAKSALQVMTDNGVQSYTMHAPSSGDWAVLEETLSPNIATSLTVRRRLMTADRTQVSAYDRPTVDVMAFRGTWPWDAGLDAANGLDTRDVLWAFKNMSGTPYVGLRFSVDWPDAVKAGKVAVSTKTEMFVTIRPGTISRLLPSCTVSGPKVIIYDRANNTIVASNCVLAAHVINGATPQFQPLLDRTTAALLSGTTANNITATITAIADMVPDLNRQLYLATVVQANQAATAWQGHGALHAAVEHFARVNNRVAGAIKERCRLWLPSPRDLVAFEGFLSPLLVANTDIYAVMHRVDSDYVAKFSWEEAAQRTEEFRRGTVGTSTTREATFGSMRTACASGSFGFNAAAQSLSNCQHAKQVLAGTSPFFTGFDPTEKTTVTIALGAPRMQPWAITAKMLVSTGKADETVYMAPSSGGVAVTEVTMVAVAKFADGRFASAPTAGTPSVWPAYIFLRHTFSLNDLVTAMKVVLATHEDGAMEVVADSTREGAPYTVVATVSQSKAGYEFDKYTTAMFLTARAVFNKPCPLDRNKQEEGVLCDDMGQPFAVSKTARNENSVYYTEYTLMRLKADAEGLGKHWWIIVSLPGAVVTSVTTTETIVGAAAIVFALIFLSCNVAFVVVSTNGVMKLKRFMRRIAAGDAANVPMDAIKLSSNNELRAIQKSVWRVREACVEYQKFLPAGLERAEGATEVRAPAATGNELRMAAAAAAESEAAGDVEMTGGSASPTAQPVVRTFDDILLNHQTGVTRRPMTLLTLQVVGADGGGVITSANQSAVAALMARVNVDFSKQVKWGGGMWLPCQQLGGLRAVWSVSRVRNVQVLACTAAVTAATKLAGEMNSWIEQGFFPAFQVVFTVTTGDADIGSIGSGASKVQVFTGPVFDAGRHVQYKSELALRRFAPSTYARGPVGVPVVIAVDGVTAEKAAEKYVAPQLAPEEPAGVSMPPGTPAKPAVHMVVAPMKHDTPEAELGEVLRAAARSDTEVELFATRLEEVMSRCKAPLLFQGRHPLIASKLPRREAN